MSELASEARVAEIYESVKRWGRWGDDDQRGAPSTCSPRSGSATRGHPGPIGHRVVVRRERWR